MKYCPVLKYMITGDTCHGCKSNKQWPGESVPSCKFNRVKKYLEVRAKE